jgi:hypothetical protein
MTIPTVVAFHTGQWLTIVSWREVICGKRLLAHDRSMFDPSLLDRMYRRLVVGLGLECWSSEIV